jgi:hypothetical protein
LSFWCQISNPKPDLHLKSPFSFHFFTFSLPLHPLSPLFILAWCLDHGFTLPAKVFKFPWFCLDKSDGRRIEMVKNICSSLLLLSDGFKTKNKIFFFRVTLPFKWELTCFFFFFFFTMLLIILLNIFFRYARSYW